MKSLVIGILFSSTLLFSGTGTGFFINSKEILTNYHVIEGCKTVEIYRDGHQDYAILSVFDIKSDLAVLESNKGCKSHLVFSNDKIELGSEIIVLGYPLGIVLGSGLKVTKGIISALTGLLNDSNTYQITAPVQPGNSGGPLLNSYGNVIGVVNARLNPNKTNTQNVNFAIKFNVVKNFLDSHNIIHMIKKGEKIKKPVSSIVKESRNSVVQITCNKSEKITKNKNPSQSHYTRRPKYKNNGSYKVIGVLGNDVLNVRSGPGTSYRIVGVLPWNAEGLSVSKCQKINKNSIWCFISYQGIDGWVNRNYITNKSTTYFNYKNSLFKVTNVAYNDRLNAREQPTTKSRVSFTLSPFAKGIKIIQCKKNNSGSTWCYIYYNGLRGWVHSRYITPQ